MTKQLVAVWTVVVLASVSLAADDLSVQKDPRADLSMFATFALRSSVIYSSRPEINNPLFEKKLGTAIRAALAARGLMETTAGPDLVVDFEITGADISTTERTRGRGTGPRPLRFAEGTLVIDLTRPGDAQPVWRGVYRDDENTGSKLVQKLPEDAKKLIDRYPRQAK